MLNSVYHIDLNLVKEVKINFAFVVNHYNLPTATVTTASVTTATSTPGVVVEGVVYMKNLMVAHLMVVMDILNLKKEVYIVDNLKKV